MIIRETVIYLHPNRYWATLFLRNTVASDWSTAGTFWGPVLMAELKSPQSLMMCEQSLFQNNLTHVVHHYYSTYPATFVIM